MTETAKTRANSELDRIAELADTIDVLEASAEAELGAIREQYAARLAPLTEELAARDKDLVRLMKEHRAELFAGDDKVVLDAGILLYGKDWKVTIPRGALGKAEAAGYHEAIKVAKNLDRALVETWPEERLFMIGARRRLLERYTYELKEGKR